MSDRQDAKVAKGLLTEPSSCLDDFAHRVIGAAIEVHRHLGPGFVELIYEEALAIEFHLRRIPFERQPPLRVTYKGHRVGDGRPDFIVGGSLIVEVKAVVQLLPVHNAQVLSYLKARGSQLGLLLNFKEAMMRKGIRRIVQGTGSVLRERQESTYEVHKSHEAAAGLVVSRGDSSMAFQAMEEDLDLVA
jgi:GxxExxY protein